MVEHAAWDYWLYVWAKGKERSGEYHYVQDTYLAQSDIRNRRFNLDLEIWCKKEHNFWTAREAALISFYRDPGKIEGTDDDLFDDDEACGPYSSEDDASEKAAELREHIAELYDTIVNAQKDSTLPTPIRREVYIEWAQLVGVDIPRPVFEALERFERESQEETVSSILPQTDEAQFKANAPGPEKRQKSNEAKLLYAVLAKSKLIEEKTKDLAVELSKFLKKKSTELGDEDIAKGCGWETIKKRLDEAHDVIK